MDTATHCDIRVGHVCQTLCACVGVLMSHISLRRGKVDARDDVTQLSRDEVRQPCHLTHAPRHVHVFHAPRHITYMYAHASASHAICAGVSVFQSRIMCIYVHPSPDHKPQILNTNPSTLNLKPSLHPTPTPPTPPNPTNRTEIAVEQGMNSPIGPPHQIFSQKLIPKYIYSVKSPLLTFEIFFL